MDYEMEELLPLVAGLAEQYTGKESTSVTREKARQLMEAVLFCIEEAERKEQDLPASSKRLSAREAYELGKRRVLERVEETKKQYNAMAYCFCAYGNKCLSDTVLKGFPAFFRFYDPKFNPTNHILTLDYPVLGPLQGRKGIDLIWEYLRRIRLEQEFLSVLPEEYVRHVLACWHPDYQELIENLAGVVFGNLLACQIAGRKASVEACTAQEAERLKAYVRKQTEGELLSSLNQLADKLVERGFGGNRELAAYLKVCLPDYCTRLRNGVRHNCLGPVTAMDIQA